MTIHTYDFEIVGTDAVWYCPECGRLVFVGVDSTTTIDKGDQTVEHVGAVGGLQMGGSVEEA